MATRLPGSWLIAWRKQVPRRAPGNRVRLLFGGVVEAVGQEAPDPRGWLLLQGRALTLPIGLGQGCRTGLLRVTQVPEDTAAAHRGPLACVGETAAVLCIGEDIRGSRPTTPGEHHEQTLVAQRPNEAREGHRGAMAEHGTPLQPETTRRGQHGIAGYLRGPSAIAQDDVGQDGEHDTTRGALEAPEAHPTQPDPHLRGVSGPHRPDKSPWV
jgi:hypothetical protein